MSEKLWRKNYIDIEPYTAGEQPKSDDIIKLFGCSPISALACCKRSYRAV